MQRRKLLFYSILFFFVTLLNSRILSFLKKNRTKKMAISNKAIFYSIFGLIMAGLTTIIILNSIVINKLTIINQCNDETCAATKCNKPYCYNGECIDNFIPGCCESEDCKNVNASNYNFPILYVGSIDQPFNTTDGLVIGGVKFNNSVISDTCLVADESCSGVVGPTIVETIFSSYFNNLNNTTTNIENGYLKFFPNGDIEFTNGSVLLTNANTTNVLCLHTLEPFSGPIVNINNAFVRNAYLSANRLIITQQIYIAAITATNNIPFLDVSSVLARNNTIQGYLGNTSSDLLINPNGGNVGFGIVSNNINTVNYTLQVGGTAVVNSIQFTNSYKAINNVPTQGLNRFDQAYLFQIQCNGPWAHALPKGTASVTRLGPILTLSILSDWIGQCSGTNKITCANDLQQIIGFPTGNNWNYETRIKAMNSNNITPGVWKVLPSGDFEIGAVQLITGDLGFNNTRNATSNQFYSCGIFKSSMTIIL